MSITLIPEERPGWGGLPTGPDQPVAIPGIGIIYHVLPEVTFVDPESDAASKGLKKGDRLSAFRLLNQPQMEMQDISGATKGALVTLPHVYCNRMRIISNLSFRKRAPYN